MEILTERQYKRILLTFFLYKILRCGCWARILSVATVVCFCSFFSNAFVQLMNTSSFEALGITREDYNPPLIIYKILSLVPTAPVALSECSMPLISSKQISSRPDRPYSLRILNSRSFFLRLN